MLNGIIASGLIANGRKEIIAGLTGPYTNSALELAKDNITGYPSFTYYISIVLSYGLGSFCTGIITPNARSFVLEPNYGPTLFLGGIFVFFAAFADRIGLGFQWTLYFSAAATGLKNGLMSLFSANLVRVAPTGTTIDIALALAQRLRSNPKGIWKAYILTMIVVAFWLGTIAAYHGSLRSVDSMLLVVCVS